LLTPRITDAGSRFLIMNISKNSKPKSESLEWQCKGPMPNRFMHKLRKKWFIAMSLCTSVQFLEVSTLQGPELHLDMSALQRPVQFLEVSTLQGPELHLDMSALKRSVLLLEVSTVHYRGLSCIWTCLPTEVCTSPGGVYTTEVCV
jgi:hypothetical protein